MPITHHPDEATLMSYSAGSLPEALRAVVAAHMAVCSDCRDELALLDVLGSALMADMPATPMSDLVCPLPKPTELSADPSGGDMALLHRDKDAMRFRDEHGDVPQPLRAFVGPQVDKIPWKRLGLGLWHYPVTLSEGAKGDLRFLKVAPNRSMPDHGHGGSELTIVLKGAYADQTGRYGRGDVADLDDTIEHQPISDPLEGCVCLVASERPARFKGFVGRLIQPLTGF